VVSRAYRWFCKLTRLVHLFLGMAGLWLLLFFSVTGFMLNHDDWFGLDEPHQSSVEGTTPTHLLEGPDRLGIVEHLRAEYGATGRMEAFEIEDDQIKVVFKKPGLELEAIISREDGGTVLTSESRGLAGWLTDLHRGKTTAAPWTFAIDMTSILFLTIAVSALLLWFTLHGRRRLGLIALGTGLVGSVVLVYLALPPQ
jgi:hypothetical protein